MNNTDDIIISLVVDKESNENTRIEIALIMCGNPRRRASLLKNTRGSYSEKVTQYGSS